MIHNLETPVINNGGGSSKLIYVVILALVAYVAYLFLFKDKEDENE